MKKTLRPAVIKLGGHDTEVELRTNPETLAERLNIDLEVAVKLSAMEVLSDNHLGTNKTTFKNWKNKRIYFTNLMDSKNSNSKQRYWDIENHELIDYGSSNFELRVMKEALDSITVDTFYK